MTTIYPNGPACTPKERRDFLIFYARTCLREASVRRGGSFHTLLLRGASHARREAASIDLRPAQQVLL